MGMEDFTHHQQKIIKRYYAQGDTIHIQKLADLATDLYLAEGKKKDKLWKSAGLAMEKLEIPAARIAHILLQADPKLLANLVRELQGKKA